MICALGLPGFDNDCWWLKADSKERNQQSPTWYWNLREAGFCVIDELDDAIAAQSVAIGG